MTTDIDTSKLDTSKLNVVVVDDNELDRYLVNRTLKRFDSVGEVREFCDGKELADAFGTDEFQDSWESRPPPLLLIDINMPLMSGFELIDYLESVQAAEEAAGRGSVLILMLTSSAHPDDEARAAASDIVHGVFQKPLDDEKLKALLAEHYPQLIQE